MGFEGNWETAARGPHLDLKAALLEHSVVSRALGWEVRGGVLVLI